MTKKIKSGFTLAEVLITLGIIGIVAALTMPTLIQKQNEKETVVKLKKFHSLMDNSLKLAVLKHGEIGDWGLIMSSEFPDDPIAGQNSRDLFLNYLTENLKVVYKCSLNNPDCENKAYTRHSLDGTVFGVYYPLVILNDGTSIVHSWVSDPQCKDNRGTSTPLQNVCGEIGVDLNGNKPPNATGKDLFLFHVTKYGIVPIGTAEEIGFYSFENNCTIKTPQRLNGYGCTAWLIYNENMDYLHCDDLSWDSKSKCSGK